MSDAGDPRPDGGRSSPGATRPATPSFAIILGLTGFAIAQPLLSLAGANPALFVVSRASRSEMVALAVAIAFVPPVLAWGVIAAGFRIHRAAGLWLHCAVVGGLGFLSGLWVGREVGLGTVAVLLGVLTSALALFAVMGNGAASSWLRYTAVLPFLALGVFVFRSESSALLRPLSEAERTEIVGETPSLVLIVFDELPTLSLLDGADGIDAGRFPNFAALASDSTWYRNYSALSRTTDIAFPTMLTGRDPVLRSPIWTNHPDNLFSLLAPTHDLTVHEAFTRMCGVSSCTEAGPSQDAGEAPATEGALSRLLDLWTERLVGERTTGQAALDDFEEAVGVEEPRTTRFSELGFFEPRYLEQWPTRFADFLEAVEPSPDPALYFLHLLLPHVPWQFYADGTLYAPPPNEQDLGEANSDDWLSAVQQQRHLLQLQYVDRLLGELIAHLKASDLYHDTALVVVADHGVSFAPGSPLRDLSGSGRPGTAYTPLFVKHPGQSEGLVSDENLMAPDLLPLLAELTNTRVDWHIDGSAPGSEAVKRRGHEKYVVDFEGTGSDRTLLDPRRFDGRAEFPSAQDRWIRPWRQGDGELDALHELLDNVDLIGRRIDELDGRTGGRVEIEGLGDLSRGTAAIPPAFVQGRVASDATPVEVLVAVDGTILTGAKVHPVDGDAGFLAMLPSSVVGTALDIQVILATADGDLLTPSIAAR